MSTCCLLGSFKIKLKYVKLQGQLTKVDLIQNTVLLRHLGKFLFHKIDM